MKSLFAALLWITAIFSEPAVATVTSGRLIDLGTIQSEHADPRRVTVWLPDSYSVRGPRHAVLYMHDGQNLFDTATGFGGMEWKMDETLGRLLREGAVRPTIVVGIWNTPKRMQEYAPLKAYDRAEYLERAERFYKGRLLSDGYLRFVVDELKPLIDRTFNTAPERESTFLMGSSMGGLISLYALAEYPDVFGGAASLSTHWPLAQPTEGDKPTDAELRALIGSFEAYLQRNMPRPGRHRIYFDYGAEWTDASYYPLYQSRMDALMRRLSWSEHNGWLSRYFPGQPHNEISWASRVDIPLRLLLAPPPTSGDRP